MDKELLLSGENKLGGESLEKETEVHGLRPRHAAKADARKPFTAGDSGPGKMPEEQKQGLTSTRIKDAWTDASREAKQMPLDKKSEKQGKGAGKPSAPVGKPSDSEPSIENLQTKEEEETNRKVHESLDNFIRQPLRCEPYMNFTSRREDKPLQRLRPDVFENHVAGKLARGFNVQTGPDPGVIASEENPSGNKHSQRLRPDVFENRIPGSFPRGFDVENEPDPRDIAAEAIRNRDGLENQIEELAKKIVGLRTNPQRSLQVLLRVGAFNQAAANARTDLQGWLPISETKCEKCAREFCSTLNYRRHVSVHRRSLNPGKEDLSHERSNVAEFWDKLTPDEAGSIVHYVNMEIEDLSGQSAFKSLRALIQQPGLPALPQGVLKAGSLLLDIVQNTLPVPLSSERLLAILDEVSEKTFLCGGTSIDVQRFVFNGEAGKVVLEEKNVIASMGFHIELKLVNAWMADKEANALRRQQALLKEEASAQQKRETLLEKRRMKKFRQKERKAMLSHG